MGWILPARLALTGQRAAARPLRLCGTWTAAFLVLPVATAIGQYPPPSPEVGTEARIETGPPGVASSTQARIARTADDVLHVVWQDYRGPQWAVYYRRLPSFGTTPPAPEEELSAFDNNPGLPLNAVAPRIATDGEQALYVVWHATSYGRNEAIFFTRSLNGGLSWSPALPLRDSQSGQGIVSEYASAPQICADALGNVHVTWAQSNGTRDQIYYGVSNDRGATWSVPDVNDPVNLVTSGHSEAPQVACDGGGVVVVAYLDHRTEPYRDVYLRRSVDWGISWEPDEIRLNPPGTEVGLELASWVHNDPITDELQHHVLAAWIDVRLQNGVPITSVHSRRSTDGGATFEPHVELLDGEPFTGRPSGPPVGGSSGGSPPPPGGGLGTGGGGTWGAGSGNGPSLGRGGPGLTGGTAGHHFRQAASSALDLDLAVDGKGRVHAVYSRVDVPYIDVPTQVHANVLDPRSGTWRGGTVLSRGGAGFLEKGLIPTVPRPQVAAAGSFVFVTWMFSDGDYEDYGDVVAAWSTNGGRSWSPPAGLTSKPAGPGSSRSAYPQLVAAEGRAAVVWDDRRHWTDHSVLPLPLGAPIGAPDVYLNTILVPLP